AGIPSTRRDVFLDNTPTEAAIDREFQRLKKLARQNGIAIGIGHPYPATIDYLEKVLPRLKAEGIRVISVADSIRYRSSVRTASVSAK
ncbi:MAG: divergent polysaccharide deacetylase family protein, partial [Gammaproteobacteria bacterium]|nr:divergent polysaccharide deacetylase family protein [Gammaproteobacteria bacterium]